jgi:hypothetical protein
MSNYSAGRGPRPADPYPGLRLAALTAVIAGVVLLAAAAFVLSYEGIHQIVLHAGVSPELARLYPLMVDAMLVVAGAAALALRGAGWWPRAYAWSCLLVLLAAVAVGDALHASNVTLPAQPTRVVVAVTPWVLLLLAFGLWLEMLQHFRRMRVAGARQGQGPGQQAMTGGAATAGQGANGVNGNGDSGAGQRTAVTWASAGGAGQGRPLPPPPAGLDALLGPREEPRPAPPGTGPDDVAAAGYPGYPGQAYAGQYLDPVSYGEETGYVHPDSYLGHGAYSGPSAAQPAGLAIAATRATEGPQPAAESSPEATAQAGPATAQTGPATAQTGPATAQTDPATAQTDPATAQTGPAAPQTDPATAQTGPAAPQTDPATAQTAAAETQTAPDHQAQPAEGQDSPNSDGDTTPAAASAATDPGPRLERLRSAPARPTE